MDTVTRLPLSGCGLSALATEAGSISMPSRPETPPMTTCSGTTVTPTDSALAGR